MTDTWAQKAADIIVSIAATIPADAGQRDRIRALSAGRPHEFRVTVWGRKTWGRAAQEYLNRYRLANRPAEIRDMPLSPLERAKLKSLQAEKRAKVQARKFRGVQL